MYEAHPTYYRNSSPYIPRCWRYSIDPWGWGSLVEYHAFEWRGIVTAKSPLVRATENLSYFCLSIGRPFGVTAIVLKIITSVREDKKIREEQLRRARADQHKQPPEKQQ